jgi:hypothetical protein
LLLPAIASAQNPQRREQLEAQITQRFLDHVGTQLQLAPNDRNRLEEHLRSTASRRRGLAREAVQLRGQLLRAARDEATTDAELTRLIDQMTRLRDQEENLWRSDQDALRRILTPRQHARFILMWIRFNDQVRDAAMRRGGPN